ncbi:MAG: GAF domain-containing protein [Candidatus Omnitrophota bacterium]
MEELARICHDEFIQLMDTDKAKNFYIAVHVGDYNYLLPYYKDEKDSYHPTNAPYNLKGGLTDHIMRTGKTELIDKKRLAYLLEQGIVKGVIGSEPQEWLGTPLIYGGRQLGVMGIFTYEPHIHYSEEDVELFDALSGDIALAIERKNRDRESNEVKENLEIRVQKKSEEILKKNTELKREIGKVKKSEKIQRVLFNISEAKSKEKNLSDLLKKIHEQVKSLMDATNFYVAIVVDKEKGLYRFPYITDENPEELEDPEDVVDVSNGLTHFVLKTEQALLGDRPALLALKSAYNVGVVGKLPYSWLGIPLRTDHGEILGVVAVQSYTDPEAYNHTDKKILSIISTSIADAVKHKQLEEEKVILEEKLLDLKKMEAMGILASGVAHEFNNLLSIIMGHAYTGMLESMKGDYNYKRYEKIERAGERAAELIEKLMILAQKRDKEKIYIKEIDKAIETAVTGFQQRVQNQGKFEILIDIKEKLWPVLFGWHEIDDIMINLLENAFHAISGQNAGDGQIRISAENLHNRSPNASFLKNSVKYIYLKISDNGHGMDKCTMAQIFNPFFTTKEPGKGTGLGLAIVFSIIKKYEGMIDVESEPGKGTTFHIFLPSTES